MKPNKSRQKPWYALGLTSAIIVLCITLEACSLNRVFVRGNLPDPERVSELTPGESTKSDILDSLGSPSSINNFGNETWYYINEKVEVIAFFSPEVIERTILIFEFNKQSQLTQIVKLGLEAGRELAHVKRITPTFGHELTVLDQIIGNFNRFRTGKKTQSNSN